jgi:tRNA modification GTPase
MSATIFAPATAPGRAGVAVVRVSGPLARVCIQKLLGKLPTPRRASFGAIGTIDHGLTLWFPAPHSFTGEDVAEFQVHGGRAVLAALSAALASFGARLAEPGEFTKRAVLNGKLDLTAAEAVADLVDAETEAQRKQALRQLGGELHELYANWRTRLTKLQAHLEATIDFADDDISPELQGQTLDALKSLATELRAHLADNRRGERLREGLHAVILGAPNAGKSSLLNRLAQREVAIVTPLAGTTRDVLEVRLDLAGYPLTLSDTAGLREASDVVEQEGIRRALARGQTADFKLLVFDASAGVVPDMTTLAQYVPGDLLIINKADLAETSVLEQALPGAIVLAAQSGQGLPELLQALTKKLTELLASAPTVSLTRERHRQAVEETLVALTRAQKASSFDLCAEDIRLASRALGRITGQVDTEGLLDVIFRDFCLGK